jgi:hypothetical protein
MVPSAWICGTTEQSSFLISFIHLQPFWSACGLTCQHDVSDSFLVDFFPCPVTLHSCYLIPNYLLPPFVLHLIIWFETFGSHSISAPAQYDASRLISLCFAVYHSCHKGKGNLWFSATCCAMIFSKLYLWYDRSDLSIQKQGSEVPWCHRDWSFSSIAARMNLLFATQEP